MNSIEKTTPTILPLLTERQKKVNDLLSQTCRNVILATLKTIKENIVNLTTNPQLFITTVIEHSKTASSQIDTRTNAFFIRMMKKVNGQIEKTKNLSKFLDKITEMTNEKQLRKKLLETTALPIIQELMHTFDQMDKTIVDGMITPKTQRAP